MCTVDFMYFPNSEGRIGRLDEVSGFPAKHLFTLCQCISVHIHGFMHFGSELFLQWRGPVVFGRCICPQLDHWFSQFSAIRIGIHTLGLCFSNQTVVPRLDDSLGCCEAALCVCMCVGACMVPICMYMNVHVYAPGAK